MKNIGIFFVIVLQRQGYKNHCKVIKEYENVFSFELSGRVKNLFKRLC